MLPCGTPISCSRSSNGVEPTLTLKEHSHTKKVDKPGEGAQLCCDWQCTEYDSVHYCVLLLFLLKFQVLKFAECYVRM